MSLTTKLKILAAILTAGVLMVVVVAVPWGKLVPSFQSVATLLGLAALYGAFRFYRQRTKKTYHKQMDALKDLKGKGSVAHGSADFARWNDLKEVGLTTEKGYIIGKFEGKFIRFNKPGHLITFAPTRSGKGVSHVIPNSLDHPGSLICNDIKGENFAVSGRYRSKFSRVLTFAPFADNSDCFNPLDFIRLGTDNELDDAALIADMIILEDNSNDPFWSREAKTMITGLILYVANHAPPPLRNMGEVRYLIMQSKTDFDLTVKDMMRSPNTFIKRIASSLSATESKVLASVISTAKSQTAVWDSPKLTKITSKSDFKFEDMKNEVISLYIIIPPEYLNVYKPVIRMMIGMATKALTRTPGKPKQPILFLIDEFPALGYMEPIESGIGYLAGYGISLWMFIQDLSQLKDLYERWATFLSNCAVRVAFGTNDVETAKTLSEMLGTTTITVESGGTSKQGGISGSLGIGGGKSVSTNTSESSRALMTPDEVMRLPFDSVLVFVQGTKPIVAEKIFYFSDPAFKGKFDTWNS